MMSLFTSFDYCIFFLPSFFLSLSCIFIMSKIYFFSSSSSVGLGIESLSSFFYSLKPLKFNKFSTLFILALFLTLLIFNFFSVFSFSFPLASQFGPVMFYSVCFWFSFILFNIIKNVNGFLSHLIPEGTPLPLVAALFLIELVSNIIRPITLTVRLVANILAGHLLMILLSKMVFMSSLFFPFYIVLNMVEMFVALIQAYIFCTMMTLYFSEVC